MAREDKSAVSTEGDAARACLVEGHGTQHRARVQIEHTDTRSARNRDDRRVSSSVHPEGDATELAPAVMQHQQRSELEEWIDLSTLVVCELRL